MTNLIFYFPCDCALGKINANSYILALSELLANFMFLSFTIEKMAIATIFNQIWTHFAVVFVFRACDTNTNIIFHISNIYAESSESVWL